MILENEGDLLYEIGTVTIRVIIVTITDMPMTTIVNCEIDVGNFESVCSFIFYCFICATLIY